MILMREFSSRCFLLVLLLKKNRSRLAIYFKFSDFFLLLLLKVDLRLYMSLLIFMSYFLGVFMWKKWLKIVFFLVQMGQAWICFELRWFVGYFGQLRVGLRLDMSLMRFMECFLGFLGKKMINKLFWSKWVKVDFLAT
jgi:hypothetical protein